MRRSFRYRLRTHRTRQRRLRPPRCCADLRPAPPDRFRSAHPDTRSPLVTAVSGRAAATIPRAGRVTTTGRIMATAIPSAGSPASDLAPVASIASLGSMVAGSMVAASMVADSTVAASTVGRLFAAEQGSAVSAPGSDIWAASAGDNWTTETDLPSPIPRGGPPAVKPQWWQPCVPARSQWEKLCAATTSQRRSFCPGCLPSRRTALPVCVPRAFSNIACRGDGEAPDHDADAIVFDRGPADVVPDVPPI